MSIWLDVTICLVAEGRLFLAEAAFFGGERGSYLVVAMFPALSQLYNPHDADL